MSTDRTASSTTDCQNQPLLFEDLGPHKVVADFTGGILSFDGGVLLLRQVNRRLGVARHLARCFDDQRDGRFVDHTLEQLLSQRLEALALDYEDLKDHDLLRRDPLLAVACDKTGPLGQDRHFGDKRGLALAAPATLNRLELSNHRRTRCPKLPHDPPKGEACLLGLGVRCLPKHARELVVELDRMGPLIPGSQEGRPFNASSGDDCDRPL